MQNGFHIELLNKAMTITTFKGFNLSSIKELQTSDIELNFRFADSEEVTVICDYHANFKSITSTTNKLLNSHLLRFTEIKKGLGLR